MVSIPAGFTPEEYLFLERESVTRHEYQRGLVYAMAGGSDDHSRLNINLLTVINLHLRDGNCQFFSGDVKVNYADAFFYYPDAFVTCDPRDSEALLRSADREDRYVKRYPKLIAEVLSPSTKDFDQGKKFADYQQIESLEEYVLIAQDEMLVECRRRVKDERGERWETEVYQQGDLVILKSIDLEVAIKDLYRGVSLGRQGE